MDSLEWCSRWRRAIDNLGLARARLEECLAPLTPPLYGARHIVPLYGMTAALVLLGMVLSAFVVQLDSRDTDIWLTCTQQAFVFDVLLLQPLVQIVLLLLQPKRWLG